MGRYMPTRCLGNFSSSPTMTSGPRLTHYLHPLKTPPCRPLPPANPLNKLLTTSFTHQNGRRSKSPSHPQRLPLHLLPQWKSRRRNRWFSRSRSPRCIRVSLLLPPLSLSSLLSTSATSLHTTRNVADFTIPTSG